MKRVIDSQEWYPVYSLLAPGDGGYEKERAREVAPELVARWTKAVEEFQAVQEVLREIVDPSCLECGHPRSRHQEPRTPEGYRGCLGWNTDAHGERTKPCRCARAGETVPVRTRDA